MTEGKPIGNQARRVGLHLVLLDVAADGIGAGHTGHRLHLRPDDPVLNGTQVHGPPEVIRQTLAVRGQIGTIALPSGLAVTNGDTFAGRRVFDRPPVNLAQAGRNRPHLHLNARRQITFRFSEPFGHLLAGEVDIGLVGEDRRDLGEAVARERAGGFEAWRAGERGFDRERDLFLDLDRRQRGSHSVDLDLDIGHVRDSIDRQLGQRPRARNRRSDGQQQN